MGRNVFERKKTTLSKTKVLCKTKPALALRQKVLKLIMILQCISSNVSKHLLIDTDTDMFIWSLIQVHRLFPNK